MRHIRISVFHLVLRAHDHAWSDCKDLGLEVRNEACRSLRAMGWANLSGEIDGVLEGNKRLIEVNP